MLEIFLLCYYYIESTYMTFLTLLFVFTFTALWRFWKQSRSKKIPQKSFSICHWNLNSLSAHNFSKLTQVKVYISIYKHDFICLLKSYLGFLSTDSFLEIYRHNLVRVNRPNETKGDGICMYYNESLPVRVINLSYF